MARILIPITIPVRLGDGLLRSVALARFQAAKENGTIERVVKQVLAETILQAYRRKVLQLLPVLLTPDIPKQQIRQLRLGQKIQNQYLRALKERDSYVLEDRRGKVRESDRKVKALQKEISRLLQARAPTLASTGEYRAALFKTLNSLTDPTNLNVFFEGDTVRWQVGNTKLISDILVPSYITRQTGKSYRKALMWKQLLYGAGVYSTDPAGKRSARGWRFLGLRIRGIRGVNLKIEYEKEALGYKKRIGKAIIDSL